VYSWKHEHIFILINMMMMKIKLILFIAFLSLAFTLPTKNNSFIIVSKIKLKVDSLTNYYSRRTEVVYDNNEAYLYRLNRLNNSIDIYSLKTMNMVERTNVLNGGPNGVKDNLGTFKFLSKDSLLVTGKRSQEIVILNSKKNAIIRYNLNNNSEIRISHSGTNFSPIIHDKNKIIFSQSIFLSFNDENFYGKSILQELDLSNLKSEHLNAYLPDTYNINTKWPVDFYLSSQTFNGNTREIIFAFANNHNLFVYSLEKQKIINEISCTSNYIKDIKPLKQNKGMGTREDRLLHYNTNPFYGHIVYDKYRDIYYRFTKLPIESNTDVRYLKSSRATNNHPFSVMVLDSNLKILSELKIEGGKYLSKDFFIDKKGLWINYNNPNNSNFSETEIEFHCYKFKIS